MFYSPTKLSEIFTVSVFYISEISSHGYLNEDKSSGSGGDGGGSVSSKYYKSQVMAAFSLRNDFPGT